MAEPAPFQALQYRFAAHLRDPEHQPAPEGLEDRRLKIYRELFYNNVEDFLQTAFPVLRRITEPDLDLLHVERHVGPQRAALGVEPGGAAHDLSAHPQLRARSAEPRRIHPR